MNSELDIQVLQKITKRSHRRSGAALRLMLQASPKRR